MKSFMMLYLLILFSHGTLCQDEPHQSHSDNLKFILYNDTSLMELLIHKDGINWNPRNMKINGNKGLQVDPVVGAILWNEGGVLTKGYLTNDTRSKVWVPEELGYTFHYDWRRKLLYWHPKENMPQENLKVLDIGTREIYGVETIKSSPLKAIDSENKLFVHKTGDYLKMFNSDGLEEKYSIQIDDDFELMEVVPASQILVVLQTTKENDKDYVKWYIKLYNYEGEELHSFAADEKYDSVFFQEPLLVMKHTSEITVLNTECRKILFKIDKTEFKNMTFKRIQSVNKGEELTESTPLTISECKETDYQEVCIMDEDSEDEDDHCIHQSYIISNGTSFKHYNPASKRPPFLLPFEITGSIRSFATYKRERIFWISEQNNSIMMNYLNMDTKSKLLEIPTVYPIDLKVDAKQAYLLWSDEGKGSIEICDLDGLTHRVLFKDLNLPRKILLALDYGSVIWTEGENNDTIIIGSIRNASKRILFQSKEPIFGFAIDYIYNILYVGSQSDQLMIHTVNINLGFSRRVFKSEVPTQFSGVLYSRNNLYLLGLGAFWVFSTSNQKLDVVSGGTFNSSFISPIECPFRRVNESTCGKCNGLCLLDGQGCSPGVRSSDCMTLELTKRGKIECNSKRHIFATTSQSVFRLSEDIKCVTQVYESQNEAITMQQPVAYDAISEKIYVAEGDWIYYSHLQEISWSIFDRFRYGVVEVVFTGYHNGPIVKSSKQFGGKWVLGDQTSTNLYIPNGAVSAIAYPEQNVFFYIENNFIHCHSIFSQSRKTLVSIPSHVDVIRISYEENRIYYWDKKTLHSVRIDGKKRRQSVFDVPSISTFGFLNKIMYFVSEEDNRLYELDHHSKDNKIKLVDTQPEGIFNLINFPLVNNTTNLGCEQLKDDDGDCFHLYP